MNYLANNIKFNGGKPYRQQVPRIYEPNGMTEVYLRSTIFNNVEIKFDYMPLPFSQWATTHYYLDWQPFDVRLTEFECTSYDSWFTVWPMYCSSILLIVSDVDVEEASGQIERAIFNKLQRCMKIHFVYRRD